MLELHELAMNGRDETPEADRIHDTMEHAWWKVSDVEQNLVNGLSGDLISIESPGLSRIATQLEGTIPQPSSKAEWIELLEWLRLNDANIPADQLAFLRGNAWVALGQHRAAEVFFREAYRLHSIEDLYGDSYAVVWIRALEAIRALDRLDEVTTNFLESSRSHMRRIASACARFQIAAKVPTYLARRSWQEIGNEISRELESAVPGQSKTLDDLIDNAQICLGFIYFLTGRRTDAELTCERVAARTPDHPGTRELRRFLRGEIPLNEESESINRLVDIQITDVPPPLAA